MNDVSHMLVEYIVEIDELFRISTPTALHSAEQCLVSLAMELNDNFSLYIDEHEVCISLDMHCVKFIRSYNDIRLLINGAVQIINIYVLPACRYQYVRGLHELDKVMHRLHDMMDGTAA